MTRTIHGILLAGGKSSRMGQNKALLPIAGKPLIVHLADSLYSLCTDVTVVLSQSEPNRYESMLPPSTRYTRDHYPDQGPLAGIHAGLSAIPGNYGFIMACDMPYVSFPLFHCLLDWLNEREADAVLCPGQPFHALYHRRTAQTAEACLQRKQGKLQSFLEQLDCQYIEPVDSNAFLNLNTPADYTAFLQEMKKRFGA